MAVVNNPYLVSSYTDGTNFYRIYSDGWCEQGGQTGTGEGHKKIMFLVPFKNTDYNVSVTCMRGGSTNNGWGYADEFAPDSCKLTYTDSGARWIAFGYI